MLLQLKCQYLQHTFLGVEAFIGPEEEALAERFPSEILVEEEVPGRLRRITVLSSKRVGLEITQPMTTADECHELSLLCSKNLVEALPRQQPLPSVGHRWELPVIHYQKIMLIYPYPFLEGNYPIVFLDKVC